MKLLTAFFAFLVIGCAGAPPVFAQTDPNCQFYYGKVLTRAQWQLCFDDKMNVPSGGASNVPLLNGANIWTNQQTYLGGIGGTSGNVLLSQTAPTISSGFGIAPSIVASNGTTAFQVNVGTGGTATTGVVGLPTAANGWTCYATDVSSSAPGIFITKQVGSSATTATFGNYNTSAVLAPWAASDRLNISCFGF